MSFGKIVLILVVMFQSFDCKTQVKLHKLSIRLDHHDFGFYHEYWNKLELISNDTIIISYPSKPFNPLRIDSIPTGKYSIVLTSIFNHHIYDSITFTKRIYEKMEIKGTSEYYSIVEDKTLFIEDMDSSDTLTIFYSEHGCFHMGFGKINIIRDKDKWLAQLVYAPTGEIIKQTPLDFKKISQVGSFERYVSTSSENMGCTTVAYYSIHHNRKIKRFTDGSCSWSGFKGLEIELFNDQ